mgnify:CR=1 FL=1
MTVDHERRSQIRANHSATHLLHEALRQALERVEKEGSGVVVILRPAEQPDALLEQIRTYHVPDETEQKQAPAERAVSFQVGAPGTGGGKRKPRRRRRKKATPPQ